MDYLTNATVVPNISTLGNLDMALLKVLVPAAVVLLMSVVLYFSSDPDYSVTQGGETIRIAPYNLPFVGHIAAAIWSIDAFLRSNR
jgi:hypothetical protein